MTRLILAIFACAGVTCAVPAQAAIALPGTALTHVGNAPLAMDVSWRHHRRHHHHPR